MIPEERRNKILDNLQQRGVSAIDDLARSLGVSRITVQRDITLLVERGLVEKIHGGVKSIKEKGQYFETVFEKRLNQQYEAKMEIAEKALSVVRDHSTIFIDSSTTCYIFARELLKRRYLDLGIITNSPAIQLEALGYPDSKIISTGGELRQNFNMLAGKWVIEFMMRVNIDAAFISTAGVSSEWNLTTSNAELAEILATVFGRTDEVNLLVDSSKFFKAGMLNIGSISRCRRVISNSEIDSRLLADIERMHALEMLY